MTSEAEVANLIRANRNKKENERKLDCESQEFFLEVVIL